MSRTLKDNRAREYYKLFKKTHRAPDKTSAEYFNDLQNLYGMSAEGVTERHGNNRKWIAAGKVKDRRAQRHTEMADFKRNLFDN
jgi:hypothetical protein